MNSAKMTIAIPPLKELLSTCCGIMTVDKEGWSETCLGEYAKKRGVYIFHKGGIIKYVGMTGGEKMDFGTRLRRHLQKSAAPARYYKRLVQLKRFQVSFLTDEEILKRFTPRIKISGKIPKSLLLIMEAALIHVHCPEFQRGGNQPTML